VKKWKIEGLSVSLKDCLQAFPGAGNIQHLAIGRGMLVLLDGSRRQLSSEERPNKK
jgi:hypothetical protein